MVSYLSYITAWVGDSGYLVPIQIPGSIIMSTLAKSTGHEEVVAAAPHSEELARIIADHPQLLASASLADAAEHELTFKQAFHKHYRAALWSMFLSTALIMEGYDMGSVRSSALR